MKFKDMPRLPLVLFGVMVMLGLAVYNRLPAQIPTHWGPSGAIDAYSTKSPMSVFAMPMILAGLYLLFWLIPYFDPRRANLVRSKAVYRIVIDLVSILLFLIYVGTLWAAFDQTFPMDSLVSVSVGILFIGIGRLLGRVERNWTMGVRYPWTVLDDEVWAKTNRLGGVLFVIAGVLAILGAFLPGFWGVALILVPALAMLPITYGYSMSLYKKRHPDE